jgi:hypothetical protein
MQLLIWRPHILDILVWGRIFVLLQRDLSCAVTFVAVPLLVVVMIVWQRRARSAFVEVREAIPR